MNSDPGIDNDKKSVFQLLKSIPMKTLNLSIDNINVKRVGKFSVARSNPRPLKLFCRNREEAVEILKSTKIAKNHPDLRDLVFAPDRTRIQQESCKEVKRMLTADSTMEKLILKSIMSTPHRR